MYAINWVIENIIVPVIETLNEDFLRLQTKSKGEDGKTSLTICANVFGDAIKCIQATSIELQSKVADRQRLHLQNVITSCPCKT